MNRIVRIAVIAWLGYGMLFTFVTFAFLDLSERATSAGWSAVTMAAVATGLIAGRRGRARDRSGAGCAGS